MTAAAYRLLAQAAHSEYRQYAGRVLANGKIQRRKDPEKCRAAILDAMTALAFAYDLERDEHDAKLLAFYDRCLSRG